MKKTKLFRVEHLSLKYPEDWCISANVGFGPYTFANTVSHSLREILYKNEPSQTNPKKERLAKIGLFSTFVDARPGPKEDPYLRDSIALSMVASQFLYGFDSREQLNAWFYDKEERRELNKYGFGIVAYYVRKVIVGLRQTMVHKNDIIQPVFSERLI